MSKLSKKYFGVDLLGVEGIGGSKVMTLIAEVESDIIKFSGKKNFISWLRLSPNNKITGGKIISSQTPKGKTSCPMHSGLQPIPLPNEKTAC